MMIQLQALPFALADLFAAATVSGKLTISDRYGLLAMLLADSLSPEEGAVIDRLLHGVRRGRVTLVDSF